MADVVLDPDASGGLVEAPWQVLAYTINGGWMHPRFKGEDTGYDLHPANGSDAAGEKPEDGYFGVGVEFSDVVPNGAVDLGLHQEKWK